MGVEKTKGMNRAKYKEARDAMCRLLDKARLEDASALVAGLVWREGEPETVCTAGVNIPDDGGETASGMTALLLYSVLARQFDDAAGRLVALDAATEFVRMLIERNPQARDFSELSDFGQGLPDMPAPPVQ